MYSYNGIGEVAATFKDNGVAAGCVVALADSNSVEWASSGKVFHGVCLWRKNDLATVQVKGFATLPYSGTTAPSVGYCELVADGSGCVKVQSGVDGNVSRLVVAVDTTEMTVTFLM